MKKINFWSSQVVRNQKNFLQQNIFFLQFFSPKTLFPHKKFFFDRILFSAPYFPEAAQVFLRQYFDFSEFLKNDLRIALGPFSESLETFCKTNILIFLNLTLELL